MKFQLSVALELWLQASSDEKQTQYLAGLDGVSFPLNLPENGLCSFQN